MIIADMGMGDIYPQKLALSSPTKGRRSVSIVLSRTQATEFMVMGEVAAKLVPRILINDQIQRRLPG
jgi:hypothetical protein